VAAVRPEEKELLEVRGPPVLRASSMTIEGDTKSSNFRSIKKLTTEFTSFQIHSYASETAAPAYPQAGVGISELETN
jgi:hypothetical protein